MKYLVRDIEVIVLKDMLKLMEKRIPEREDYLNDFLSCLKKGVGKNRSKSVTPADFESIAIQAADDLGDFNKVPEAYDNFTRAVVKNMIPSFVDCVFSINEDFYFFQKNTSSKILRVV